MTPDNAETERLAEVAWRAHWIAYAGCESPEPWMDLPQRTRREWALVVHAVLAAQQPLPVVQAFHGDDPARPARDDDPVHDAGAGE